MKCECGSDKVLTNEGLCPDCGKDYLYKDEFQFKPIGSMAPVSYDDLAKRCSLLEKKLLTKIKEKQQAEAKLESTTDDLRIATEALERYRSIPIKTPVSFLISKVDYVAEEAFQRMGRVN